MKYTEGRDGLEGTNVSNDNNRAEEREIVAAIPCLSFLVYYVVNSPQVFKPSSACFVGVRKAQLTSLCLLHVHIHSECHEKDMSMLSLCQPEVPCTEIVTHVRKYDESPEVQRFWKHF